MRAIGTAVLGLGLWLGLNLPTSLADLGRLGSWALPLEVLGALALVAATPARLRCWTAGFLGAVLGWFVLFRLGDWALYHVMGRPITLLFDIPLVPSLVEIVREIVGPPAALALLLLPIALLALVAWGAAAFLLRTAALPRAGLVAAGLGGLALLAAAAGAVTPSEHRTLPLVSLHGLAQVADQVGRLRTAETAEQRWAEADAVDPAGTILPDRLLSALAHTDVIVLFVESYGRTALESEPFRDVLGQRLQGIEASVGQRGLAMASGWLHSPTVGGQSWLAHATLASGVLIDDEAGYEVYLRKAHADLAHLFARTGHRTVLAAPGIVRPYPRATERMGFHAVHTAADLGYAGPRLDWVTMPDQFTLAAVARTEQQREPGKRSPLFLQAVLIGSHAPFTPLPSLAPNWDEIGDGRIFGRLPITGEAATALWRDPERLRLAYRDAVDLVLASIEAYVRQLAGRPMLLVVLGDHEPAALITGDENARTVPIHLIATDQHLLQPFLDWGFAPGMLPRPDAPVHPMKRFRNHLITSFSPPDAPATAHEATQGSAPSGG
jgi:hypothetical protein